MNLSNFCETELDSDSADIVGDDDNRITTISVRSITRNRLELYKRHHRESFDEVLTEMLDFCESGIDELIEEVDLKEGKKE